MSRDRSPERRTGSAELKRRNDSHDFDLPKISIDYKFGDAGSSWRMIKLKRTLEAIKERSSKSKTDIILERYGTEIEYDVATQERNELDQRKNKPKSHWIYEPIATIKQAVNNQLSLKELIQQERNFAFDEDSAKAILKDSTYSNDTDYQDENAAKLASFVNSGKIRMSQNGQAQQDPKVLQRIMKNLDRCELCNKSEVLPISMGQYTYLTLLPYNSYNKLYPSNTSVIVVDEHYNNTLYCEDEEWDEIENFMKTLAIYYYKEYNKGVIFIENAVEPIKYQKNHAHILAVPVPLSIMAQSEGYFREGILSNSDELDDQHSSILNTKEKSKEYPGSNRRQVGFKQLIAKEAPYYHVWFNLDGGIGHIVQDFHQWPKYDLFTRQIVGEGLLKCDDPTQINNSKDYKKWVSSAHKGEEKERVEKFRKKWDVYDWTKPAT
ncbi:hypothetical protein CLIB1423_10S03884 [[Candida] railenensis]|uniref:Uncharacterized protein n=1 Tax=[Candida] railenensis TaxID=45579 RepID=A0A9P0QRF6_9ASCO|nr:hypothetical protein CLIB1423_10S03884 [[Candida] railenensis]